MAVDLILTESVAHNLTLNCKQMKY